MKNKRQKYDEDPNTVWVVRLVRLSGRQGIALFQKKKAACDYMLTQVHSDEKHLLTEFLEDDYESNFTVNLNAFAGYSLAFINAVSVQ